MKTCRPPVIGSGYSAARTRRTKSARQPIASPSALMRSSKFAQWHARCEFLHSGHIVSCRSTRPGRGGGVHRRSSPGRTNANGHASNRGKPCRSMASMQRYRWHITTIGCRCATAAIRSNIRPRRSVQMHSRRPQKLHIPRSDASTHSSVANCSRRYSSSSERSNSEWPTSPRARLSSLICVCAHVRVCCAVPRALLSPARPSKAASPDSRGLGLSSDWREKKCPRNWT